MDRLRWRVALSGLLIFGLLVWHATSRSRVMPHQPLFAQAKPQAHHAHRLTPLEETVIMAHEASTIRMAWVGSGQPPLLWSADREEYYFHPGPSALPDYGSSAALVVYLPRSWPPPTWTRWAQSGSQDIP